MASSKKSNILFKTFLGEKINKSSRKKKHQLLWFWEKKRGKFLRNLKTNMTGMLSTSSMVRAEAAGWDGVVGFCRLR